ncbi:MAG: hypothetical protein DCC49_11105 [Acidobacteria bacterium]|nr:MAG: hypothetical protein DCC49_11105 [Acidobacteriota bacterium]
MPAPASGSGVSTLPAQRHTWGPPTPPDATAGPSAHFVFPADGAILAGDVGVAIEASDTAGVVAPVRLYLARSDADPRHLGHPIGERGRHRSRDHGRWQHHLPETTETISAPGESVLIEEEFNTLAIPDGNYRLSAVIANVYYQTTHISVSVRIDNTAPRVRIRRIVPTHGSPSPGEESEDDGHSQDDDDGEEDAGPGGRDDYRHGGRRVLVRDSAEIFGTVRDANLASWSLEALIDGTSVAVISAGTEQVLRGYLGTYSASMAPPGYSGPVEIVLMATDTATPVSNRAATTKTVISDYYLDAYGSLLLAPQYEVSTTIPVMASVTGELGLWRLDIFRESETEVLITRTGTTTGAALHLADFDVANTFGAGTYVFDLAVTDSDGDTTTDRRIVTFIWRPAHLAITYVGPPIPGPGPTTPLSEFTDPTISGIVEVRGQVSGSNIWAWALGRPIAMGEPSFAGDKIVFSSNIDDPANFDIYQLDLAGTDLVRLTNHPGFDYAPRFSADAARIVFSSTRDYPAPQAGTDIYVMGADGTNIARLTDDGVSASPTFSPGATHVAFVRPGGIFELELSTGTTIQLTSGEDALPHYSPDGTRLIFDRGIRGHQQIFAADLTAPGYPTAQIISAGSFSGYPQYSPDGSRITYVTDYEIYVANADGTNIQSLGVTGVDPTFTPDGARIAYALIPAAGPDKIYLIGSDPANPGTPEELVIPGSSRVPDASSPQLPFPPAPAANEGSYAPIDIASFVNSPDPLTYWGYLRAPPNQLPTGEMATDSILGYIDASRLPPGVTALSLTALQCEPDPPPFDYGLEIPPDTETQATIDTIATCDAYSTPQIPLRVLPKGATVELGIDVLRSAPGYAGPLGTPKSFAATGSWEAGDRWAFSAGSYDGIDTPELTRQSGRKFASGPPASDGSSYAPVGDLAALEDLDLLIGDPALGLKVLSGAEVSPTPVACGEVFAPGRTGCRYEVDVLPGHLGNTAHVTAYSDGQTGLLGAITWSYSTTGAGSYTALPGPSGWGPAVGPLQSMTVRIVFSGYGRDQAVSVPDLGAGP